MTALAIEVVTSPNIEPVELADVRRHIKASSAVDNSEISVLIAAAREYVELKSGLIMLNTSLLWSLDGWGVKPDEWWDGIRDGAITEFTADYITIPRGPLVSITSIKTYNDSDVATTWSSANYQVDKPRRRVKPRAGQSWPVPTRGMNGIEITFVAGHGEEAKNTPPLARLAIMMQCAHLYQNRGDTTVADSPAVLDVIDKFKIKSIA